ncbi:MAG: hypothetical protein IPJ69_05890 [Deltaproteobacteria bacterium]|nr:MAG: hypothetical protein IPJ69_05890 [Deltaproteobacteria bacterium]
MPSLPRTLQTFGLATLLTACGAKTGLEDRFPSAPLGDAGLTDTQPTDPDVIIQTPPSPVMCGSTAREHCVVQAVSTYTATVPSTATSDTSAPFYSSVCALMADGHVKIRGHRINGTAITTVPELHDIVYADGNNESLLAFVGRDGSVWVWGHNEAPLGPNIPLHPRTGMTGIHGDAADRPSRIDGLMNIVQIVAGRYHLLALDKGGNVYAWGENTSGQLGNGTRLESDNPTRIEGLPPIQILRAGWTESVALDRQGRVWTWGQGLPTTPEQCMSASVTNDRPILNPEIPGSVRDVHTMGGDYFALNSAGQLYAWGCNQSGWIGDGNRTAHLSPIQIFSGARITFFNAYYTSALALSSSHQVFEWGDMESSRTTGQTRPTLVPDLPDNIVSLDAGYINHRVAITRDGIVYVWGDAASFGEGRPPTRVEF